MNIILIVLLVATWATFQANGEETNSWEQFKLKFGKEYSSRIEDAKRKEIFLKSLAFVEKNNGKNGVIFRINQMADMELDEESGTYNDQPFKNKHEKFVKENFREQSSGLPNSFDYRSLPTVSSTEIKTQGNCSSCWAQAAVTVFEYYSLSTTGLVTLSAQEIIDCVTAKLGYKSKGCFSGLPYEALDYISIAGRIHSNANYQYIAAQNPECKASALAPDFPKMDIPSPHRIWNPSDYELKMVVYYNYPSTVRLCAKPEFIHYGGGVLEDPQPGQCYGTPRHSVVLLGWGTSDDGTDFWQIRNSWDTTWGEKGYGRIKRENGKNHFHINSAIVYLPSSNTTRQKRSHDED